MGSADFDMPGVCASTHRHRGRVVIFQFDESERGTSQYHHPVAPYCITGRSMQ
jgi:hypothetical protein